jgi:hypothetical protein
MSLVVREVDGARYTTKISYDAENREQYVGSAYPGTATSDKKWMIKKLSYDGTTTRLTDVQYAGGQAAFLYVWDDRATYTYS